LTERARETVFEFAQDVHETSTFVLSILLVFSFSGRVTANAEWINLSGVEKSPGRSRFSSCSRRDGPIRTGEGIREKVKRRRTLGKEKENERL